MIDVWGAIGIAVASLMIGVELGAYSERHWQRWQKRFKEKMDTDVAYYENGIAEIQQLMAKEVQDETQRHVQ